MTDSVDTVADVARRFGGLERLYGVQGAASIRGAHVAVVGMGGVGSWAVETLARSGVGRLTLIDMDHVSESNVNRQIHALTSTLGQAKVLAMRDRIAQINPHGHVQAIDDFVTPGNWSQLATNQPLLEGVTGSSFDAVIDACDQVKAKTAMANWAMANRVPFITVGAAGGKRQAHLVDIDDLSLVTHDPLLAQLRYQLRKHHGAAREAIKIGVACVFSREAVQSPDPSCAVEGDGSLNCHGYGSSASVTATFGHCAAGWVLERLSEQAPNRG